jgi:flagellar basal-body rod protein FlgG
MSIPSLFQILNVSRSGMMAKLLDLDTTSNNLANINTIGFKNSRTNFQEILEENTYAGVQLRATQLMMEQGALSTSDDPLHLAISGEGFFAVTLADGQTAFTRNGEFQLDSAGQIVNASGNRLVWEGDIPQEAEDIHVNPDGSIMVAQGGIWTEIGHINLSRFPTPEGLIAIGNNQWIESEASGMQVEGTPGEDGFGSIISNALEQSNVDLASEMTHLITLQRAFDMSLRAFQQTDQMLGQAIRLRQS